MNWKQKAAIQRAFSRLPFGSETAYYQVQRRFGNLRHPESPLDMIRHAAEIFGELAAAGMPLEGARVLEVGTGHRLNMPLAFYLAGAQSIISVDLYRILKPELVMESLRAVLENRVAVSSAFTSVDPTDLGQRLDRLAEVRTFEELISTLRMDYRAPCDATATGLPPCSVDIHFSYTVFEHVPPPVLVGILCEASRLISERGLICHHIDLSDHFSHSDASIGKTNFLQFSSDEWKEIDNERFGYQNRLRVSDYRRVYDQAGQQLYNWITIIDPESIERMNNGFPLAAEYREADRETLATVSVRAISRPRRQNVALSDPFVNLEHHKTGVNRCEITLN